MALKRVRNHAGIAAQAHAAQRARDDHRREQRRGRNLRVAGGERQAAAGDRTQRQLALGTDVPDVRAIADGQPGCNQHQRARLEQQFPDAVARRDGLEEESAECGDGVLAESLEDDEADDQRGQRRQQG